jgi:GT2 family glycosyltransferase
MLDISVVLYNSARWLPAFVRSILEQSCDLGAITLLVYDNASADNSAAVFEQLIAPHRDKFRRVIVVRGPKNIGFGRGHNRATARGHSPYVCVLNPDTELKADCLEILLCQARNDPDGAAWEMRQAPYEHPKTYDPLTFETEWVSAAGVVFRRSAFEEVDGFDECIFLYGEDVDLSWRLRDCGYTLRYCPTAVLLHHTYNQPREVKPAQFIGSIQANLYLRTRFGTWRDIAIGLRQQFWLLRGDCRRIAHQRFAVLRVLTLWLASFLYWRRGSQRKIRHCFREWDYSSTRVGTYHDISAALSLAVQPRVSVLIRTVGRQALLRSALRSVAHQTYRNIEVVIVEDGPATLSSLLRDFQDIPEIVYYAFGHNKGRSEAGNKAMELATGEYFVFLDEDDLFYADHVEQLVASAVTGGYKVTYSYAFELPSRYVAGGNGITAEGELFSRYRTPFSFTKLLQANFLPINTVLFHRSVYDACGGFDPNITYNEDWNLWVRYAIHSGPFQVVPKTTCIYRIPLQAQEWKGRHEVLKAEWERVRQLQSSLPVTTTVGQIVGMIESACSELGSFK